MRVLRFGLGLGIATLLHVGGLYLWPSFSLAFDLFLVAVVFNALDGNSLAGVLGGLAAGLVADALSGGLFGLHGMVDTIIGYGTAITVQRLVIQRATGAMQIFAVAAALQQSLLMAIILVMLPSPIFPELHWLLVRVATTALLGLLLFLGNSKMRRKVDIWKRTRTSKVRFSR